MPHADPGFDLNCPKCPRKLTYITSMPSGGGAYKAGDTVNVKIDTHVYRCSVHGGWRLGPDGLKPHPTV